MERTGGDSEDTKVKRETKRHRWEQQTRQKVTNKKGITLQTLLICFSLLLASGTCGDRSDIYAV